MSYCRFSSNNFACDVYVYESCGGGFVTYVAGNRVVGDVPKIPIPTKETLDEFGKAYAAQSAYLQTAQREPIDLPHAGGEFRHDTADECADNLVMLRALGYNVPQYAIDRLREEAKNAAQEPK